MRRIPSLAFAIAFVAASSLAALAQGWGPGSGSGRGMGPCAHGQNSTECCVPKKCGEACRLLEQSQRQRCTRCGPPEFHDGVHEQVSQATKNAKSRGRIIHARQEARRRGWVARHGHHRPASIDIRAADVISAGMVINNMSKNHIFEPDQVSEVAHNGHRRSDGGALS